MEEHKYTYNGPVLLCGKYVGMFNGETVAQTEKRAQVNLEFQAKRAMNLSAGADVTLPDKIKILY